MQQFASAFHFLSASINLRPSRGQTFMLMAVALSHLDDTENAAAAYEQAVNLDHRDPAISLNYAVMLAGTGNREGAAQQLQKFEERVTKLRQSNLDADTEVSWNLVKEKRYKTSEIVSMNCQLTGRSLFN